MSVKDQAIIAIQRMPETSTWHDVAERMPMRIDEWLQKLSGRPAV